MIFLGCASDPKSQTGIEIWSFDPDDYSIYRKLNNGEEEMLSCGDTSTNQFKAMHNADLKILLGLAMRECGETKP